MLTCNGCKGDNPSEPEEDKGILEKLDRLVSEDIEIVHVGVCRLMDDKKECPRMTKICEMIDSRGIQVIRGTHREWKEERKTALSFIYEEIAHSQ